MFFSSLDNSKPRSVLIPIIFFIFFDCVALTLNFWISYNLTENAIAINIAGRQRMLSQRMTKALFQLINNVSQPSQAHDNQVILSEFNNAVFLFDQTLTSFWSGGETLGGNLKPTQIKAITAENARINLAQGNQLWGQMKQQLLPLINNPLPANASHIQQARISLEKNNLALLKLMNDLTLSLEQNSAKEARYLRLLQSLVLILALVNFSVVCIRLLTNLKSSKKHSSSLDLVINSVQTAVLLITSDSLIKSSNAAANYLFGFNKGDLIGTPVKHLLRKTKMDCMAIHRDGRTFKVQLNEQELVIDNQSLTVCSIIDISEQIKKEQELAQLAFHDPLTNLPNRLLLMERLNQELLRTKRTDTLTAVLFLDLDGFKAVNDTLGHDIGDKLLKHTSTRLKQCCREDDTVARLGGDEFVIILSPIQSITSVEKIADTIVHRVNQDFLIEQHTISIGVSIGISIYPKDHLEAELLLKYADEAMYKAKETGKNKYCLYSKTNLH